MKKVIIFFTIYILTIPFFYSCKQDKENNNPIVQATPTIQGDWTTTGYTGGQVTLLAIKDSIIFASANGIYRSTDNGNSWAVDNSHRADCFLINGNDIFISEDDFIFRSDNNGNTWALMHQGNGYSSVFSLAAIGSNLYEGTESGVRLSVDNGMTWTDIDTGLPPCACSYAYVSVPALAVIDTNLFAGTAGVYLYNRQNMSWSSMSNGIPDGIMSLAVDGNNIFAGTWSYGIYLSSDNGATWTAVSNGLPRDINGNGYKQVHSITISGAYIFAIVNGGGLLYLSTDNGTNWTLVSGFPTNATIRSVAIKDNVVYAGGGIIIDPNPDHLIINGQIWKCPLSSLH